MKNRMALCNWSPIRTAPKGGADIWLSDGEQMTLGYWGKSLEEGKRRRHWCWVDSCWKPAALEIPFEPTHWQRIPNPPGA